MPSYRYQARDSKGASQSGVLEGIRAGDIAAQLEAQGLIPTAIDEQRASISANLFQFKASVSLELLIMFSRQMHALLSAGVPITRAIRGLAESNRSVPFQEALLDIGWRLETGVELNRAFNAYPEIFPSIYVALIRVGEETGKLDDAFQRLAVHLEREREAKRRFKQATRYPLFLLLAIVLATVFINLWVIPGFDNLFSKFGSELPLATRVLVGVSEFFQHYSIVMFAGLILLGGAFLLWLNTEQGALAWHKNIIKLPVVGELIRYIALSRFAHSFSMVVRAGMPITEGLSIASTASGNHWVKRNILNMREVIERGESLYPAALISGVFTNMVLQMIAVGEESGKLDVLLEEVAQFYDEEVDYSLKTLADVIEPILIVAMGGVVLILALGVALPIWELGQAAMGS